MVLDLDTRSQFSIVIFSSSLQQGNELRSHLTKTGYEVFVFNEQDTVIHRTAEAAPHLVVVFLPSLQSSLSEFIEGILKENAEVQFVVVGDSAQVSELMAFREYNVTGFVPLGENLENRILWEVDLICSDLYRMYQNEHLYEETQRQAETLKSLEVQNTKLEKISKQVIERESLADLMNAYSAAHSKEEIVDAFVEQIDKLAAAKRRRIVGVFFRFLPTVNSFVATHAAGMDVESLRGVGGKVTPQELSQLEAMLKIGQVPTSLMHLLQGPLNVKTPVGKPLFVHKGVEGLFVFWDPSGAELELPELNEMFLIFTTQYQLHHLSRRVDSLNIEDSLTGLLNREQFHRRLDEEIARARRLKNAVALVKLTVDHLVEYEQAMGPSQKDNILRSIAAMVRKTSRINDAACRTGENEISVILPHSPRKGAAIRAERIRRMVEAHDFPNKGMRITVSIGVSEYPTLSKSSTDLDRSSQEAMKFISERGGNKVCLFKPPEGFRPDYDVVPV